MVRRITIALLEVANQLVDLDRRKAGDLDPDLFGRKQLPQIVELERQPLVPIELFDALAETHALEQRDHRLWRFTRFRGWQLVKAVMRDASIAEGPHMTPKGLRHSFGIHAIRSGVPLNLVQRWLGHASMTTTAIYLDALGEEEREIAARMWARAPAAASSPRWTDSQS